jgi:hypothetical protein
MRFRFVGDGPIVEAPVDRVSIACAQGAATFALGY